MDDEDLTTANKVAGKTIRAESVLRILRIVSMTEAFHFFIDIGQCNGKSATSLANLYEKSRTIPLKSIGFHFKHTDFECLYQRDVGRRVPCRWNKQNWQACSGRSIENSLTKNSWKPPLLPQTVKTVKGHKRAPMNKLFSLDISILNDWYGCWHKTWKSMRDGKEFLHQLSQPFQGD